MIHHGAPAKVGPGTPSKRSDVLRGGGLWDGDSQLAASSGHEHAYSLLEECAKERYRPRRVFSSVAVIDRLDRRSDLER
ncbi:MAG: hypothetical protein RJA70_3673, partial [Pseudomonadota bacterium]